METQRIQRAVRRGHGKRRTQPRASPKPEKSQTQEPSQSEAAQPPNQKPAFASRQIAHQRAARAQSEHGQHLLRSIVQRMLAEGTAAYRPAFAFKIKITHAGSCSSTSERDSTVGFASNTGSNQAAVASFAASAYTPACTATSAASPKGLQSN